MNPKQQQPTHLVSGAKDNVEDERVSVRVNRFCIIPGDVKKEERSEKEERRKKKTGNEWYVGGGQ
jgi:hypothetical protein